MKKIDTQIDNAKDFDVVMQIYNLIQYSENQQKTTGIFLVVLQR